jgi:hypothetical protein
MIRMNYPLHSSRHTSRTATLLNSSHPSHSGSAAAHNVAEKLLLVSLRYNGTNHVS